METHPFKQLMDSEKGQPIKFRSDKRLSLAMIEATLDAYGTQLDELKEIYKNLQDELGWLRTYVAEIEGDPTALRGQKVKPS